MVDLRRVLSQLGLLADYLPPLAFAHVVQACDQIAAARDAWPDRLHTSPGATPAA